VGLLATAAHALDKTARQAGAISFQNRSSPAQPASFRLRGNVDHAAGTLARQVTRMRPPLTARPVVQVRHTNREALMARTRTSGFPASGGAVASISARPGIVDQETESADHAARSFRRRRGFGG